MSGTIVKYHLLHQLKSADLNEENEMQATMVGTSYRIMSGTSDLCLTPVIIDSVTAHNERTDE